MKILGIDPGWENVGWGVVESGGLVGCGVIVTKKGENRLKRIYEELAAIMGKHKPEMVAVESLFFFKNAKSVIKVAKAIGVIEVCAANNGLEVVEVTPLQVKMGLTGYGRADKDQVERMVGNMLGLEKTITPSHAADAVAVAIVAGGI